MDAAQRIFAADFNHPCVLADRVETLTGAPYSRIFIVGVLTWVEGTIKSGMRARVSDPTGTFLLLCSRSAPSIAETLSSLTPPAYVALCGSAVVSGPADEKTVAVIPETVSESTREVRDTWILRTATCTLERLEKSVRHRDEGRLNEITEMLSGALSCVSDQEITAEADPSEEICALLDVSGAKEGMRIDEIAAALSSKGFGREDVSRAVMRLVVDGECYLPRKDRVKRL